MKKISIFILSLLMFTSCYEDYVKDFDYSTVCFANQINTRTVVVGESMEIKVGAVLTGIIDNQEDRVVTYQLDNSLVTPDVLAAMKKSSLSYLKNSVSGVDELIPMPEKYVSFSDNSKMVIPAGDIFGTVTVTLDESFLSDPAALKATYALPFKITSIGANIDSINSNKATAVIGLKYENKLFGNYWHGGKSVTKDAAGATVDESVYHTAIPQPDGNVWSLTTVAPNALVSNRIGDGSESGGVKITLNDNGSVNVSSVDGSDITVENDGESTFNQSKLLQDRKLFLNYKFTTEDGNTTFCTDTLTFRNRLRDGVNEWQDENQENYK